MIKQPKFTKNKAKTFQCVAGGGFILKKELFFFLRIRLASSVAKSVTKASTVGTNSKERSKNFKLKKVLFYSRVKLKMVNEKINRHTMKLLLDPGSDISILNGLT